MMLNKITIKVKYTGVDKRGTVIGGVPFLPGLPAKTVSVDEDTYLSLLKSQEGGWLKIEEDNYDVFLAVRGIKIEPIKVAEVKEVEVKEVIEEPKKAPVKKATKTVSKKESDEK